MSCTSASLPFPLRSNNVAAGLAVHHDLGLVPVSRSLSISRPICGLRCFSHSYCLRHRPTESLILPTKRRFFPFRIPNLLVNPLSSCLPALTPLTDSHTQLRHYISTADPDRIYVVVERIVYAIHIAAQKRESIAIIPFEPRCLAAGYGWIAVGGPENGECAFIRIGERGLQVHGEPSSHFPSDVDSALPLDLESPSRLSSPGTSNRRPARRLLPEFELHKFGGTIVNSVAIHRFPADSEGVSSEDVTVLRYRSRRMMFDCMADHHV